MTIAATLQSLISRRNCLGLIAGTTLFAQSAPARSKMIRILVTVTDRYDRNVNGLRPTDFHVFEDGILQTIFRFSEGRMPPMPVNDDGAIQPPKDPQSAIKANNPLLENVYTITYYPDPSNENEGFRKLRIEIVPDVKKTWTVRHAPGYRP
jgi:hypothetical protein